MIVSSITRGRNSRLRTTVMAISTGIAMATWAFLVQAAPPSATVVEFYNVNLKHYFLTADSGEAVAIDNGSAGAGWKRTGGQFGAFKSAAEDVDTVPVCRFYGTPGRGPNSHFYTAVAAECAAVKTDAGWTYEGIAFYVALPANGACKAGTQLIYRSYNNGFARNDTNHRYTADLTAQLRMTKQGFSLEGAVMCAPLSDADIEADIVRLLEQSTMGPTEALIAEVKTKGIVPWLDEQLGRYETKYAPRQPWGPSYTSVEEVQRCAADEACFFANANPGAVICEFYTQSIAGRDQVRLRFAYALHQLFVLGQGGPAATYANSNFQQMIRDVAFSTYEDALFKYTVSPQLGLFQGWINNVPEHDGVKPNENFAREIQQLLSTGVNRLNEDGTEQKDSAGQSIPVYTQPDVTTMSRILTGYTYAPLPGAPSVFPNLDNHVGSMVPFDAFHDKGAKSLYGGTIQFAAGQGAEAELRAAVKALVAQPSTPPFIAKQLIQRLVTSSPTPDYVRRIVAVFKDNGAGVRGDLKAVLRAILLDPEARGARKIDPEYGKMREPALFLTSLARALDIKTDGLFFSQLAGEMNMSMFSPATIFGYFPADFRIFGGSVPAAEFGIFGTAAYVTRTNAVNRLILAHFGGPGETSPRSYVPNAIGTSFPTMDAFLADTGDAAAYVERLNRLLYHGAMTPSVRATMTNAVGAIPASDGSTRAKLGAYLAFTSLDYMIQK